MVPATVVLVVAGCGVTAVLLAVVLVLARRFDLVAVPNARSFHHEPTPSIGGIAIVIPLIVYLAVQVAQGVDAAFGLVCGGLLLAVIGLWDDLKALSSALRFGCHIAAVTLVLLYLDLPWPLLLVLLAGFLLVWHVNLFNFMDGIDGIAGVQALFYCVAVSLLSGGIPGWLGELTALQAGTLIGFLAYNWPPAKIFMGDVCSGFLGLLLGFLALALDQQGYLPLVASVVLLAGFWFDASYTLCVRMLTGQKFTQAHRSHLYQKVAARKGHQWTTLAYGAYCTVWLAPLAWLAISYPAGWLAWLVAAPVPAAFFAWRFGAGLPDSKPTVTTTAPGNHDPDDKQT